jgi:hypothetical protein
VTTGATPAVSGPSRRLPPWLPRVLFESTLIVFSVLLALALNEWRAGAVQRQRVAQAVAAIRAEVEENGRLTRDALAYHEELAESFSGSVARGDAMPDMDVITQGLLAPARVLRTAWEAMQNAGLAAELSYDLMLTLSRAYAQQAEYEALSRFMVGAAYERALEEGLERMISLYPNYILLQRDFAGRERMLLREYDAALNALAADGRPVTAHTSR